LTYSKQNQPADVLGIDYGLKRVGTALLKLSLAEPLGVIANDEHLIANILDLCRQHNIDLIIVGLSESHTAQATQEFIDKLAASTDIAVETWDETLSTQEAAEKYQHALNKYPIDALAACAILEDWQACLPKVEDAETPLSSGEPSSA